MPESLPRPLLVLTAIVAAIALFVGIRDYLDQKKEAKLPTTAPVVEQSNGKAHSNKKTASAKTRRARISSSETNASASGQASAEQLKKQLARDEVFNADANAVIVLDTRLSAAQAKTARDGSDAAMDRDNREQREFETIVAPGSACLPLPNLTQPGDVDAPYYQNWAREYCGI
jgi:hypothetical protein